MGDLEQVAHAWHRVDDADTITKACAGADALFLLVPPDLRADSIQRHIVRSALPACEAITTQWVDRLVAVSSLGRAKATSAGQVSATFAVLRRPIRFEQISAEALAPAVAAA